MSKVFVASDLEIGEIQQKFNFLFSRKNFEYTFERKEADFILLDLSHPPDNWPGYIYSKRPEYIAPDIPCIFHEFEDVKDKNIEEHMICSINQTYFENSDCEEIIISRDEKELITHLSLIKNNINFNRNNARTAKILAMSSDVDFLTMLISHELERYLS